MKPGIPIPTSAILLDVIIVAVLLLFAYLGAKKGFVLTLCSLVAVLVAIVGANLVADLAAPMVADAIQPKLEQAIEEQLNEALSHTSFTTPEGGTAASPEDVPLSGVLKILQENELYQQFMGKLEEAIEEGAASSAASAAAQVATVVAEQVARGILFIIAFFILLVLWGIFSHALDLVTKLPVLDQLNHSLGGVIGLVKGLVIAYIAVWILYGLAGYVPQETMEKTYIFRFLALHSPLDLLGLM